MAVDRTVMFEGFDGELKETTIPLEMDSTLKTMVDSIKEIIQNELGDDWKDINGNGWHLVVKLVYDGKAVIYNQAGVRDHLYLGVNIRSPAVNGVSFEAVKVKNTQTENDAMGDAEAVDSMRNISMYPVSDDE